VLLIPLNVIPFHFLSFQRQDDSIVKIQGNKYALGKHENVWLTEEQHKEIKFNMKKGYLIEQVSDWKNGRKNVNHNNDFTLIRKFAENFEKQNQDKSHDIAKAMKVLKEIYSDY